MAPWLDSGKAIVHSCLVSNGTFWFAHGWLLLGISFAPFASWLVSASFHGWFRGWIVICFLLVSVSCLVGSAVGPLFLVAFTGGSLVAHGCFMVGAWSMNKARVVSGWFMFGFWLNSWLVHVWLMVGFWLVSGLFAVRCMAGS